ncbi:MAG TPA: MFS transporter [Caulobacteraceae bacterium]
MQKPRLSFPQMWNISFGFFGIQVGFALQGANVSRIFQTLGASVDALPILWIAGPVTGLIVQPIIGHFSDRTWTPLGRRRPYFLAGALLSSAALLWMPNAAGLWLAAGLLWMLDASINISMEPFRAFVGDMLDSSQRTAGYAFQTAFIGAGAVVASLAPLFITKVLGVSNIAPPGQIPPSVRYAFYAGAAALLCAVLWTVISTREHPPAEPAGDKAFEADAAATPPYHGWLWALGGAALTGTIKLAGLGGPIYILGGGLFAFGLAQVFNQWRAKAGRPAGALGHILGDLFSMPGVMARLAVVQFCSWSALFILWIFTTPVVAQYQFGSSDPTSRAYNDGADWVGVLFAVYNGVAAVYAFILPALVARIGRRATHMLSLAAGAAGFAAFLFIHSPTLLLLPMVGVGIAWSSILTLPYAILCDAVPQTKLGVYMGLFNIFIVLPQLVVSTVMGAVSKALFPHAPIYALLVAAGFMLAGAAACSRLDPKAAA